MTTLRSLRQRRTSIQSTQKLMTAMKTVAGVRLRHLEEARDKLALTRRALEEMIADLAARRLFEDGPREFGPLWDTSGLPLTACDFARSDFKSEDQQTESLEDIGAFGPEHWILLGPDMGFCGGTPSRFVRFIETAWACMQKTKHTLTWQGVGKKLQLLLRGLDLPEADDFISAADTEQQDWAQETLEAAWARFKAGNITCVRILYIESRSLMQQHVRCQRLLPFPLRTLTPCKMPLAAVRAFCEPHTQKMLTVTLKNFLTFDMRALFTQTALSEQSARVVAMDSAARNAQDLLKRLQISYNRTRQSLITGELIEIIAGMGR